MPPDKFLKNPNPTSAQEVQLSIPPIPRDLVEEVLAGYRQKEYPLLTVYQFCYSPDSDRGWYVTMPRQERGPVVVRFQQPIGLPAEDVVLELCIRGPVGAFFTVVDRAGELSGLFHAILGQTKEDTPELVVRFRVDYDTAFDVSLETVFSLPEGMFVDPRINAPQEDDETLKYAAAIRLAQEVFQEDPYSVTTAVLYQSLAKRGYYWDSRVKTFVRPSIPLPEV